MSKRLVEKLNAKDDAGQSYVINIYRTVIDTSDMRHGRSEALGGLKEAITSNGDDLNYVDERTFQFVHGGKILHVI